MKILYVAVEAIYPANTGSRIRAYQLVKALSQMHEVGLAYISADNMESISDIHYRYTEQIKLQAPLSGLSSSQKASYLLQAILQNSFPMTKFYLGDRQVAQIRDVVGEHKPDMVVLQSSYILPLAKEIKRSFPNIRFILDAHNIESLLQTRMAETASSTPMRPIKKLVARNLAKIEELADRFVSGIAAVSEEEAEWFKKYNTKARVEVIPNGVDIDYFKSNKGLPEKPVIAFCGSMSYLPNHEGVIWFFDNVWPTVKKSIPEAEWLIIGKDPPLYVRNLAEHQGITVTGTVDDVRTWLEKSRLSIVPLLSGGGTRLKILEAMSMERTVVSTHLGAEGIMNSPGIIRVDNPNDMAEQIIKLLRGNNLLDLGKQNRSIAIEKYSWKSIGNKMLKFVDSVTV